MCPTITVGSFFFLDTKGPLFCSFVQQPQTSTTSNLNNSNLRSVQNEKKKQNRRPQPRKHTLAPLFFSTFFEVFWIAPEGPPFICFDILQHNGCQKIAKGPPLTFFGTVTLFKNLIQKNFFWKVFHVSKGPPFDFFQSFCNQLEFHKARKVPLFNFEP